MKFTVADITITERTVELPDVCPQCGADVTSLITYEDVSVTEAGAYAYSLYLHRDDDPADHGDSIDATTAWCCNGCSHMLISGTTKRYEEP